MIILLLLLMIIIRMFFYKSMIKLLELFILICSVIQLKFKSETLILHKEFSILPIQSFLFRVLCSVKLK